MKSPYKGKQDDKFKSDFREKNMAGIIPVAKKGSFFKDSYIDDTLVPIGENYYLIERAVEECAYAGCKSIWIVCHNETQPFLRERIGEYINDPVWFARGRKKTTHRFSRKFIPIFYIPTHPNDKEFKDSIAWSIVYGILFSNKIAGKITRHHVPQSYYICFPNGISDIKSVQDARRELKANNENTFFTYKGKTALDGEFLSFTMKYHELYEPVRTILNAEKTEIRYQFDGIDRSKMVRDTTNFTIDKVFQCVKMGRQAEVEWYHKLDSWDNYREFLGSDNSKGLKKLWFFNYEEFRPICVFDSKEESERKEDEPAGNRDPYKVEHGN